MKKSVLLSVVLIVATLSCGYTYTRSDSVDSAAIRLRALNLGGATLSRRGDDLARIRDFVNSYSSGQVLLYLEKANQFPLVDSRPFPHISSGAIVVRTEGIINNEFLTGSCDICRDVHGNLLSSLMIRAEVIKVLKENDRVTFYFPQDSSTRHSRGLFFHTGSVPLGTDAWVINANWTVFGAW